MQTDILVLQDQNEVFSTRIKSEKGKGDNISKALESDDVSEGKDADFLSTLIESLEPGAESSELRAESSKLKAESSGFGVQGSEVKAQSTDSEEVTRISTSIKETESPQIPDQEAEEALSSKLSALSSQLKAESPELKAESSQLKAQSPEFKAESSKLKAESPELKAQSTDSDKAARISTIFKETESPQIIDQEVEEAETRLPLQGTSGQGSKQKAESPASELKVQSSEPKAESPELKAESSKLKAESPASELKVQSSEPKAESADLKAESSKQKAGEALSSQLKAESTDSKLKAESPASELKVQSSEPKAESPDSKLKAESSKQKAESPELKAQSLQLKAQGLNPNSQEAGEIAKNLTKNPASLEATPKIESDFQNIKTITKNTENFDKNLSHKEPDNVLLFPESQSSDRVSDTSLHAKETQSSQKPLQTEVLTQIVKKAAFNLKNGQTEVKIDLKPEFLGRIQLKISTENHQVMVRILTEIPLVKDIIENNINHLKADLQNHGLEIDKFDVFLARDSDQYENGHENAEFLKKNGKTGEGEVDGILAKEMEEEAQFAEEKRGANLIGVFA